MSDLEEYEVTWAGRRCLCDDGINGVECYCYDSPRCACDDCQAEADAGRGFRAEESEGVWL